MKLVFFQPRIPQNLGTLSRLTACLNTEIIVIKPMAFVMENKYLTRSAMDYLKYTKISFYADLKEYDEKFSNRKVLLVPHQGIPYTDFVFQKDDHIILGREDTGLPLNMIEGSSYIVNIPINRNTRSLNTAIAGAVVLCEAYRQTNLWPM